MDFNVVAFSKSTTEAFRVGYIVLCAINIDTKYKVLVRLKPLVSSFPAFCVQTPALCVQTPAVKKTKKGKTISPLPRQAAASVEPDHKAEDKVSPADIIPHIVLNVSEKDSGSAKELLSDGPLPALDEVRLTDSFEE